MVAFIYFRADICQKWYFDSGSSRHMTGNKDVFTDIQSYNLSFITFGDGLKKKGNW